VVCVCLSCEAQKKRKRRIEERRSERIEELLPFENPVITMNVASGLRELMISTAQSSLSVSVALSVVACALSLSLIPSMSDLFVKAGLFGNDLNKPTKPKMSVVFFFNFNFNLQLQLFFSILSIQFFNHCSPEAQGVVCGTVYLICLFLFIPVPFLDDFVEAQSFPQFPHQVVSLFSSFLIQSDHPNGFSKKIEEKITQII